MWLGQVTWPLLSYFVPTFVECGQLCAYHKTAVKIKCANKFCYCCCCYCCCYQKSERSEWRWWEANSSAPTWSSSTQYYYSRSHFSWKVEVANKLHFTAGTSSKTNEFCRNIKSIKWRFIPQVCLNPFPQNRHLRCFLQSYLLFTVIIQDPHVIRPTKQNSKPLK